MRPISAEESRVVTRFAIFATLLVVMCHADDPIPREVRSFYVSWLGDKFSDANVCNFFFLSGWLLARRFDLTGGGGYLVDALGRRMKTLLVPYVCWNVIYYVFHNGLGMMAYIFRSTPCPLIDAVSSCEGVVSIVLLIFGELRRSLGIGFLQVPSDTALWYIKTLFYFIVVSPFAFRCILASRCIFVVMLMGILCFAVVGEILQFTIMPYFGFGFHLLGFAAFLTGGYCSLRNIHIAEYLRCINPLLLFAIWVAFSLTIQTIPSKVAVAFTPLNIAIAVGTLIRISDCVKWDVPPWLSRCLFFVYAAHLLVMYQLAKRINSTVGSELRYVLLVCVPIAVCIMAAHTLNFVSPKVANILSGGRFAR